MAIAENIPIMAIFRVLKMGSFTPRFFWAIFSSANATTNNPTIIARNSNTKVAFSTTLLINSFI